MIYRNPNQTQPRRETYPFFSLDNEETLSSLINTSSWFVVGFGSKTEPQCCKTTDKGSSNSVGCPFQALGEHLTRLKLSTNNEDERVCIVASHLSNRLSLTLTLVNSSTGDKAELLYKAESLETFERVSPKWMRDVVKFSTNLTYAFFERLSRVTKAQDLSEMDALYAKLYDRYTTLKKKKFSELDEVNREQEEKFLTFVSASETLTQHLRSEIENLNVIVERLRNENTEFRYSRDEERLESQKCLLEEQRKNKALSEEVVKLRQLISEGVPHNYKDQSGTKRKTPQSPQVTTRSMRKRTRQSEDDNLVETDEGSPTRSLRKGGREAEVSLQKSTTVKQNINNMVETDEVSPKRSLRKRGRQTEVSPQKSTTETLLVSQPQCCKTTDEGSSNSTGCPFHALGEHLTGMKLSTSNEGGRVCIVASHSSSGLSFSLTLINNSNGEEAELLYNVISLGTFQRVVPTWMRGVNKFNTNMIPLFFERVSRVIKPRG
ncbi:unnamed protein product [Eruca vesicaria subsp. sativa]|uniref:DUF7806 domain-containing protein n=1 Tax=Eruca vesicaria subsp. sativa TaxID=29727 RepID=A0ABC8JJQ7_ERUVS|nr:unnamed protein product [Eruca vesicaria subsp. sativa]